MVFVLTDDGSEAQRGDTTHGGYNFWSQFVEHLLSAWHYAKHFTCLILCNLKTTLWGKYCFQTHFPNEETEV